MNKVNYGKGIPTYRESDLMTVEELHDFGIEIVCGCIQKDGFEILSVRTELGIHPSIIAKKDDVLHMIEVASDVAPRMGEIPDTLKKQLIDHSSRMDAVPCFASVGFGSTDAERFDASLALRGDGYYANFTGLEVLGVQ